MAFMAIEKWISGLHQTQQMMCVHVQGASELCTQMCNMQGTLVELQNCRAQDQGRQGNAFAGFHMLTDGRLTCMEFFRRSMPAL